MFFLRISLIAALLLACGCETPYYKQVNGTDTLVGLSLPDEQYIQINALHYLNGSKTQVKGPARIEHEWSAAETNSYFGIIRTEYYRRGKIKVEPEEANGADSADK